MSRSKKYDDEAADPGTVGVSDTSGASRTSGFPDTSDVPGAAAAADGKKRRMRPFGWVNGPSRAIALAGLVMLLVLFGRDVLSSWYLRSEIADLEKRKRELLESLAADSILLKMLDDPEFLERYAREHYLMRKEGETVYMIEER